MKEAMLSRLNESDISPIFSFCSSSFLDINNEDNYFFHHPLPHPHSLLTTSHDPNFNRDTSTEAMADSSQIYNKEPLNDTTTTKNVGDDGGVSKNKKSPKTPRKRTFTKDRHSKIVTAQGPRDRRMRLSLPIARKFFMVQDMLGYDKASKTVEWLLTKSNEAINEMTRSMSHSKLSCTTKSGSSTSECEVVSGLDEMTTGEYLQKVTTTSTTENSSSKERRIKQMRKSAFSPLTKESRAKARERARERTMGKMWSRSHQQCPDQVRLQNLQQQQQQQQKSPSSQSHDLRSSSMDVVEHTHQHSPPSLDCQGSIQDIVDESFSIITNKSRPSPLFTYHQDMEITQSVAPNHNSFPNFPINWDIDSASSYCPVMNTNLSCGNIEEQQISSSDTSLHAQFADIQFYRPWDPYNNPNLYTR